VTCAALSRAAVASGAAWGTIVRAGTGALERIEAPVGSLMTVPAMSGASSLSPFM
jgi:hypothetical protein